MLANTTDGAATAVVVPNPLTNAINANMLTPPDGQSPRMQMYLFEPIPLLAPDFADINGGDDASVIYHEFTHGLTNRLVIDGTGDGALNTPQAGAMGEAWSDFYAMDFLITQGFETDTDKPGELILGRFLDNGHNTLRTEAVDCTLGAPAEACPRVGADDVPQQGGYAYDAFGKILGSPEVHADSEIWSQTLFELRRALVAAHGADEGGRRALALVTGGLRLSPDEPSFLDMRNSILAADTVAGGRGPRPDLDRVRPPRHGLRRAVGRLQRHRAGRRLRAAARRRRADRRDQRARQRRRLRQAAGRRARGHQRLLQRARLGLRDAQRRGRQLPHQGRPGRHVRPGGGRRQRLRAGGPGRGGRAGGPARRPGSTPRCGATGRCSTAAPSSSRCRAKDLGCGPGLALDANPDTGISFFAPDNANDPGPKVFTIKLPAPVDVSSLVIDPSGNCGDDSSASLAGYEVEFSKDGTTFQTASSGQFGDGDNQANELDVPEAARAGVRFVRMTMKGNQGGSEFMDMTELSIYGASEDTKAPAIAVRRRATVRKRAVRIRGRVTDDYGVTRVDAARPARQPLRARPLQRPGEAAQARHPAARRRLRRIAEPGHAPRGPRAQAPLDVQPGARVGLVDLALDVVVPHAGLAQAREHVGEGVRHAPVGVDDPRAHQLLDHLGGEPVDRRGEVRDDEDAVGVAAVEQLDRRLVAALVVEEHRQPVAVQADPHARVEQALDVVEVVGVAGVGDLDLVRVDALLEQDLDLARAGVRTPGASGP